MALKSLSDVYQFKGNHEKMVRDLTQVFDSESGAKVFNTNIELFMSACLVGVTYKKKSKPQTGDSNSKIFKDQFDSHIKELSFIYKIVMLNSEDGNLNHRELIDRAFRDQNDLKNLSLLEEYMLGGVEILHEKFITPKNSKFNNYLISLITFSKNFQKEETSSERDDEYNFSDMDW